MKTKTFFIYYGQALLSAPEVAAFAKHDMLAMSGSSNFITNANAIRAINPNTKCMLYVNWADLAGNHTASPAAALQQASREGWVLVQSPASSPTAPMLLTYIPDPLICKSIQPNTTKVGLLSGKRYGPWYVENVIPTLPGIGGQDGFFVDVAALGPNATNATTVDAAASGTVTAAAGASTITDSGKAWAVNVNAHRVIRMTSGANAGKVNYVLSNTATALTLYFPFANAPQIGDTYEGYGAPTSTLGAISGVNADYKENAASYNLDSIEWSLDIASAYRETMDSLLAAYPTALVIANGAAGFDGPSIRGLPRDRVACYYEGAIHESYGQRWVASVTQTMCNIRRLASFSTQAAKASNSTDYIAARYGMSAALLADSYIHVRVGSTYTSTTTLWLDEFDIDVGEPASDTARNSDGTWSREFTQAYVVANPTEGTIVVQVPPGFRRILASSYTNQDPTLNDGSTNAVSLLTKTAVMFVRA